MNIKEKMLAAVSEHGLADVLFHLSEVVDHLQQVSTGWNAVKFGEVSNNLKRQSQMTNSPELLVILKELYGKPKVRLLVLDRTRDLELEYKFTIAVLTPDEPAVTLREFHELDRVHADLRLRELHDRYHVVDMAETEWFPVGAHQSCTSW